MADLKLHFFNASIAGNLFSLPAGKSFMLQYKMLFNDYFQKRTAYKRWVVNYGLHVWDGLDTQIQSLPYIPFKLELKKSILQSY